MKLFQKYEQAQTMYQSLIRKADDCKRQGNETGYRQARHNAKRWKRRKQRLQELMESEY